MALKPQRKADDAALIKGSEPVDFIEFHIGLQAKIFAGANINATEESENFQKKQGERRHVAKVNSDVVPADAVNYLDIVRNASATIRQALGRMPDYERRALLLALAREHGIAANEPPAKSEQTGPRPRWETRPEEDKNLTPEQFVEKYYAAEKAAVTPRPEWDKDGPYGSRPAEFIALAFKPEMMAGTLHRGIVGEKLAAKLASWLRSYDLPDGIDIPNKLEWIKRVEAAAGPLPSRTEAQRRYTRESVRRWRERSL